MDLAADPVLPRPMRLSELIFALERLKELHGDTPVVLQDTEFGGTIEDICAFQAPGWAGVYALLSATKYESVFPPPQTEDAVLKACPIDNWQWSPEHVQKQHGLWLKRIGVTDADSWVAERRALAGNTHTIEASPPYGAIPKTHGELRIFDAAGHVLVSIDIGDMADLRYAGRATCERSGVANTAEFLIPGAQAFVTNVGLRGSFAGLILLSTTITAGQTMEVRGQLALTAHT